MIIFLLRPRYYISKLVKGGSTYIYQLLTHVRRVLRIFPRGGGKILQTWQLFLIPPPPVKSNFKLYKLQPSPPLNTRPQIVHSLIHTIDSLTSLRFSSSGSTATGRSLCSQALLKAGNKRT